jgi:hypothetical protein
VVCYDKILAGSQVLAVVLNAGIHGLQVLDARCPRPDTVPSYHNIYLVSADQRSQGTYMHMVLVNYPVDGLRATCGSCKPNLSEAVNGLQCKTVNTKVYKAVIAHGTFPLPSSEPVSRVRTGLAGSKILHLVASTTTASPTQPLSQPL